MTERSAATSRPINSPLKWHIDGGKSYLAKPIITLMPPRCRTPNKPAPDDPGWLHYVEPYFGGGSVLLANDPEGISEVANDRHKGLTNFWRVLQDTALFDRFKRIIDAMPFSKEEWEKATAICGMAAFDATTDQGKALLAANFFVHYRQSLSGRMNAFTGITRNRARRGMNAEVSAWLTCIEGLPVVHARLIRVLVLNDDALTVIRKEDGPRTLFYLDPPYLHETRATTGEYAHEMSYQQHRELLEVLKGIKGRFLLSGYDSDLYRGYSQTVPRWNKHEFDLPNNAAGGGKKRRMVECVWCNY